MIGTLDGIPREGANPSRPRNSGRRRNWCTGPEESLAPTGPNGLLGQLTKMILEAALSQCQRRLNFSCAADKPASLSTWAITGTSGRHRDQEHAQLDPAGNGPDRGGLGTDDVLEVPDGGVA